MNMLIVQTLHKMQGQRISAERIIFNCWCGVNLKIFALFAVSILFWILRLLRFARSDQEKDVENLFRLAIVTNCRKNI